MNTYITRNLLLDSQNDSLIAVIGDWQIYITNQNDCIYLAGPEYVIAVLGQTHKDILSLALHYKVNEISYQIIHGIELLEFSILPIGQLIMMNDEIQQELAESLPDMDGVMTIVTPTTIHNTGLKPEAAIPHPTGRSFVVLNREDVHNGRYATTPREIV